MTTKTTEERLDALEAGQQLIIERQNRAKMSPGWTQDILNCCSDSEACE